MINIQKFIQESYQNKYNMIMLSSALVMGIGLTLIITYYAPKNIIFVWGGILLIFYSMILYAKRDL